MKKVIIGSIALFGMASASNIGGSQTKITENRCGDGLKIYDVMYDRVWGQCVKDSSNNPCPTGANQRQHDIYDEGTVRYRGPVDRSASATSITYGTVSAWVQMVNEYPGIDGACEKFNKVLIDIANDFTKPAAMDNQYVSSTHSWKNKVTLKLHEAGCAISPNDDNLEQFIESFNYPHQQRLRMSKAARAADEYVLKIGGLQDDWREARKNFVSDMKAHGSVMDKQLRQSEKHAGAREYQAATDALLGEQEGSARVEISKIRGTIASNARSFEDLAHKLKRDGLRWSKLNQISNEQERLDQMTEVLRMTSFDVLSTCLTNFQKEMSDRR